MTVLVTGGGGFLGKALVARLIQEGEAVRSFARSHYPDVEALGATGIQGDLSNYADVANAVKGCKAVFHVAAKAGVWGSYDSFFQPNVVGTRNVIKACNEHDVPKLIYTSTPSVVFDNADIANGNERLPYPQKFSTHYAKTKSIAEKAVLKANTQTFNTVALRPHLIWGPGDTQLAPRIIDRARAGRLVKIGHDPKLVDATYIDNVVDAHVLAWQALAPNAACAGQPYFISNDEPIAVFDMINGILQAAGEPPLTRTVSVNTAYAIATIMEAVGKLVRLKSEPPLTKFVVKNLSTAHWFDISAAKRDLGYHPQVSMETGLARLADSLK